MSPFNVLRRNTAASAPAALPPKAPEKRRIDPAAYGFVPAAEVRADRAGPSTDRDTIETLVAAGDWSGIATFLGGMPTAGDRRFAAIDRLGAAAVADDSWLNQWLAAEPKSVTALAVFAESLVDLAFKIRTEGRAENVTGEQWTGFRRVLRQVPAVCARATAIDADDPAPWVVLQTAALGLQWTNEEYRALWSDVSARAPHSLTATQRAFNYWRPRWYGSTELMEEFIETAIAAAPAGSTLTMLRIQMLHDEIRPAAGPARTAFNQGDRMNQALDAGIADAAAADQTAEKLPFLRHWLAYELWLVDRNLDAIKQFQAVGGFCDAAPWTRYTNPRAKFCEARATAAADWEDAGRPE